MSSRARSHADEPIDVLLQRLDALGVSFSDIPRVRGIYPGSSLLEAIHALLDYAEEEKEKRARTGDRRARLTLKRLKRGIQQVEPDEDEEDEGEDEDKEGMVTVPRVSPDYFFRYTCEVRGKTLWMIAHEGLVLALQNKNAAQRNALCTVQVNDRGDDDAHAPVDVVTSDMLRRDENPVGANTTHALTEFWSVVCCPEMRSWPENVRDLLYPAQWDKIRREFAAPTAK